MEPIHRDSTDIGVAYLEEDGTELPILHARFRDAQNASKVAPTCQVTSGFRRQAGRHSADNPGALLPQAASEAPKHRQTDQAQKENQADTHWKSLLDDQTPAQFHDQNLRD